MPASILVTATDVLNLREQMHLSRAVFARYLHINERTLENWEQGRAKPNAQAAVLLRLVQKYPDTVERLAVAVSGKPDARSKNICFGKITGGIWRQKPYDHACLFHDAVLLAASYTRQHIYAT